jgi:hypothetical protein
VFLLALAATAPPARTLAALSLLAPLFIYEWFSPVTAIFQGLWYYVDGVYSQIKSFVGQIQHVVDLAWGWLKALLTWTARQLVSLVFVFDYLWNRTIVAGFSAASDLFGKIDSLLMDVFRPVHIVLQKITDYALFILIAGTVNGLAVIPDFVKAVVAAKPHLVTFAQTIETAIFAERQAIAAAFALVRGRVNNVSAWLNGLVVFPGRLHVGALMYALVEYLPWWLHAAVVFGITTDVDAALSDLRELYDDVRSPAVAPRLGSGELPGPDRIAAARAVLLRLGGVT